MGKPIVAKRLALAEGFQEYVPGPRLSDEELLALYEERFGNRSFPAVEGNVIWAEGEHCIEPPEPVATEHDGCEICGGYSGFDVSRLSKVAMYTHEWIENGKGNAQPRKVTAFEFERQPDGWVEIK